MKLSGVNAGVLGETGSPSKEKQRVRKGKECKSTQQEGNINKADIQ